MSSNQQYKDYNKRLKKQLSDLQKANEGLNNELKTTSLKLYEFRKASLLVKPKSNLWKYIWVFNFGFALGIALMYFFR